MQLKFFYREQNLIFGEIVCGILGWAARPLHLHGPGQSTHGAPPPGTIENT